MGANPEPGVGPERAAADRDAVLEAVYREHYGELVGLARYLVDEQGQAEETVQEAFARTYEAWPRLRDRDDPIAYVRRAVVNLARGRLRRRSTARRAQLAALPDSSSAESAVLADARKREVVDAVLALPRRQRECIVLRYYTDCSTAATAAALGISDGAVKQHVHRAMQALEVALGDDPEDDP